MKTMLKEPDGFDFRKCPIWAIPQIGYLRRQIAGLKVIKFQPSTLYGESAGVLEVDITGEGRYTGLIKKSGMNVKQIPALFYAGPRS